MALTAQALIAHPPQLHGASLDGRPHQWTLAREALAAIDRLLKPGYKTLETGAGASTVLFALNRTEHTCVVPSAREIQRIRDFCAANGVSLERVSFVEMASEEALPALRPDPLDLVLIDGSHSFPCVFIDFHYSAARLRAGGWLVIDDTHLWTARTLRNFLRMEPDWELIHDLHFRTAIFQKRSDARGVRNWTHQPFVLANSALTRRQRVATMARERDWRALAGKALGHVASRLKRRGAGAAGAHPAAGA